MYKERCQLSLINIVGAFKWLEKFMSILRMSSEMLLSGFGRGVES
jgi:hypothetical protein